MSDFDRSFSIFVGKSSLRQGLSEARRIEKRPACRSFSPDDATDDGGVRLTIDAYEALRLPDEEGFTREACAAGMNIARTIGFAKRNDGTGQLSNGTIRTDVKRVSPCKTDHASGNVLTRPYGKLSEK